MILSRETIEAITERKKYRAQVRRLHAMNIPIHRLRPDGSPVVLAADFAPGHAAPMTEEGPRVRDP